MIASAVRRSDAATFRQHPGSRGEDRDGHDRSRHQRPASAHALSARFRCLLLAFSIVSVGTVIGSLGLPRTVLRFVAEGMTRNQPGRARRAPAWRYCGRRAENIRGEREAQLSRIRASSACKALVKLVRGSRPTCTQRKKFEYALSGGARRMAMSLGRN